MIGLRYNNYYENTAPASKELLYVLRYPNAKV